MNKNQKGFSLIIVAAAITLMTLLAGGAYIWQQNQPDDTESPQRQAQAVKTYRDTAQKFTFTYPERWSAINPPHCCEGPAPDPSVTPLAVNLLYPGAPKMSNAQDAGEGILGENTVRVMYGVPEDREKAYPDRFTGARQSRINGYELLMAQSTERYGYLDAYYLVSDGSQDIVFAFRAKQTAKAGLGAAAFDESAILPTIEQIVKSTKFL